MKKEQNNHFHLAVGIVLLIAIGLVIGTSLGEPTIKVYSQESEELNLMNVNSTVTKDFAPNRVELSFGVETLDASAKISQQKNAELAEKVISQLKFANVSEDQIETMNYSVKEEYEWDGILKKNTPIGYRTKNTIKVTLKDTSKAGDIIDVAVEAGVNKVDNIAFTLSKEKQEEAKALALNEAAEKARIKANNIAQGLGVIVGRVHTVSENSYYSIPRYNNYNMVGASETKSVETPISPSDVSVSATVTVVFEI